MEQLKRSDPQQRLKDTQLVTFSVAFKVAFD